MAKFMAICSVTLSALREILPGRRVVDFVDETQTGARVVTTAQKTILR